MFHDRLFTFIFRIDIKKQPDIQSNRYIIYICNRKKHKKTEGIFLCLIPIIKKILLILSISISVSFYIQNHLFYYKIDCRT